MTTLTAIANNVDVSAPSGVGVFVLPQRFDVHEVAQFESAIEQMLSAGALVVIDASDVRYLDRSAMDSLIKARLRCMDQGGDLMLATPSVSARVILELSGRYEALNPIEAGAGHHLAPVLADAA